MASNANTILRTTDAGATWSTVFSTGSSATLRLNSLTCTGSECIAIAYPKGNPPPTVEVSTDAGRTWRTVTLPLPAGTSQPYIDGVSCGTPTFCVAVGDVGDGAADVEWWTDNAGATWSDKEFALSLGGFGGVACTSAQFCVAAASQTVLVSTTGPGGFAPATGAPKWTLTTNQAVACVPGTTTCIVLADSDNCGQGDACTPVIAVSLGGETWTSASLPNGLGDLSSISCATTGYCVAGGYQQGLFDTSGTQGPPRATFLLHSHGTLAAWSRISLPKGTLDGLAGLSCATTSFCVGGGVFNHYVNDQTPYNSFVLIGPAK